MIMGVDNNFANLTLSINTVNDGDILALFVRGTGLIGIMLYTFIYIVWGLYGVAATQSSVGKNIMYNLLDIASKNFYGAFIFVYALTLV